MKTCRIHRIETLLIATLFSLLALASAAHAAPPIPTTFASSLKADSFSKSPLGFTAAMRFAKDLGADPQVLRDPRKSNLSHNDTVWILDPTIRSTMARERREALHAYLSSDATLIVSLPKRYAAQRTLSGQELTDIGLVDPWSVTQAMNMVGGRGTLQRPQTPAQWGPWGLQAEADDMQCIGGMPLDWTVLVGDASCAIVAQSVRANGADTYIVSDADLFANLGLGRGDNAAIFEQLLRITRHDGGTMYVDEAFHGYLRTYSPLAAAIHHGNRWIIVQIALLALIVLWMALGIPRIHRQLEEVSAQHEQPLDERTGAILNAKWTPVERVHKYRALLIESVTSHHGTLSGDEILIRIHRLEDIRQPNRTLASLDRELRDLSDTTRARKTYSLLRAYQQWFSEVTDATG